jgi:ribosomal-protein-alanine N-acetyltransferase
MMPAAPPLPVRLREATPGDAAAMAVIEAASFPDPWPSEAFVALIGQPHVACTAAVTEDGALAGYCVVIHAGPEADVANVATAPAYRGRQVASRLLRHALAGAGARGVSALFLEVREGNAPARALYARHGFRQVGRRPRYYQHPLEDALVLRCDLALAPGPPAPPAASP